MSHHLFASRLRRADGWAAEVAFGVEGATLVEARRRATSRVHRLPGTVVPAVPNLHSHAFQRAIAGLAEVSDGRSADFWWWRQAMYRSLAYLTPDDIRSIATQLYVEMVKAGYSRVCEFHYLHNDPDGHAYTTPVMCSALIDAAATAGIRLTLVPVLYTSSNFGGRPPEAAQLRFVQSVDRYVTLVDELRARAAGGSFDVGMGFHSLRAASPEQMREVLSVANTGPIHLHIAEQVREVEDCLAWCGSRPVEWLIGEFDVDERWCLVHATHMTDAEARAVAASGATVALCPTTEGNLGDGFFNADSYFEAGGRWGVGSDSHVSVDPREELRLLEYGRRLRHRRRTLSATAREPHVGAGLWLQAAAASAPTGRAAGLIEIGQCADFVVLDDEHPQLVARNGDQALDSLVFVNVGSSPVLEVWIDGRRVVADGRHASEEAARRDYAKVIRRLRDAA